MFCDFQEIRSPIRDQIRKRGMWLPVSFWEEHVCQLTLIKHLRSHRSDFLPVWTLERQSNGKTLLNNIFFEGPWRRRSLTGEMHHSQKSMSCRPLLYSQYLAGCRNSVFFLWAEHSWNRQSNVLSSEFPFVAAIASHIRIFGPNWARLAE